MVYETVLPYRGAIQCTVAIPSAGAFDVFQLIGEQPLNVFPSMVVVIILRFGEVFGFLR